jgi:hypothetical protein
MLISFSIEFQTQSQSPLGRIYRRFFPKKKNVTISQNVIGKHRQAGHKTRISCNPCLHKAEFCDGFSEENVTICQNVYTGPVTNLICCELLFLLHMG